MSFVHGKGTVFKLDDLTGSLADISAFLHSVKYSSRTDRPETQCFGDLGKRHQVTGLREATIGLAGYWQQASGTKLHGKSTRIILDQYPLTGYLNKASARRTVDLPETQCFGDAWKRHQVVGLVSADISLSGLFDSVAGGADQVFRAATAVDPPGFSVTTLAASGFTIGNLVEMFSSVEPDYNVNNEENAVVDLSASLVSDSQYDVGVSLHDLTAETTAGTVNYASVNESAATSAGGVGHIHVSAYSGWANAVVKIQHSTNDSVWADLITFTTITAVTSQRSELSATATVNQYVRATVTFTGGSGSMTFAVAFGRRTFTYGTAGLHRHFCGLMGFANTSTFQYGPEGSASGKKRFTGECRASNYSVDFDENGMNAFSLDLVSDSTITEDTF